VQEFDQKGHGIVHVGHFEKFLLSFHVEENLTYEDSKWKIEDFIIELLETEDVFIV
jgi:hypothetical protein